MFATVRTFWGLKGSEPEAKLSPTLLNPYDARLGFWNQKLMRKTKAQQAKLAVLLDMARVQRYKV